MHDFRLTAEQLEFRDAIRDFVEREVKPAAIDPKRLEPFEKPLMTGFLDQLSQMGLRGLALPEDAGGAGADLLTRCVLLEEIAAGDVDLAMVLGETALLASAAHGAMTEAQRARWVPKFEAEDRFHLALLARDGTAGRAWSYHQAVPEDAETIGEPEVVATRDGKGWTINGLAPFVSNAPVAGLFIVQAKIDGEPGTVTVLLGRDARGLEVDEALPSFGDGGERARWHHGAVASVVLNDCKVGADDVIAADAAHRMFSGMAAQRMLQTAAVNVGVARAAYEAAVDYAKMRWQGGRHIIEHQSIGMKLADVAIQLEAARALTLKAAWITDHPDAVGERHVSDLPWHVVARSFTAQALHRATLESAECFGAMGVMRDMPLQKYVHDTLVLQHSVDCDLAAPLAVAEAVAGYSR
ncbi:MAG: acyl-CoA dehydrogenase family protein [Burkholderiales bacterium]|nr:acyl-CoA dehydrogenase family protein [Burkholderiales bacterium]